MKAGYMGWLGYFIAFKNDIFLNFLAAISALAVYYVLVVSCVGLRKEIGVVLSLVAIGCVPVAYEPAHSMFSESTSNNSFEKDAAR